MSAGKLLYAIIVLLVLGMAACTTEGCYLETESDLYISLNETEDEDVHSIDSLTVYGLGVQSDSLYKDATENNLLLPLDPGSSTSVFVIVNGLVEDTLRVNYNSRYNFVSKGCGYNYLYTIESVSYTKNRIDTILIINKTVTPDDEENLRTFF